MNNTIRSFHGTLLVSSRLLSRSAFERQLPTLLHQLETSIPTAFARSFDLAQAINRGNALMSVYESNYRYVTRANRTNPRTVLYAEPVRYHFDSRNCSCDGQSKCFTPAAFVWPSSLPIKGLFIGCLPSESLLASTVECFFDQSCVDLLHTEMLRNATDQRYRRMKSLGENKRRRLSSTVKDLLEKLFMETWTTNVSYERYFLRCAPNQCLYSYIDNANPLYVLTTLLGLYGGLKVVLTCWSAQLVCFVRSMSNYCKRQRQITPTSSQL